MRRGHALRSLREAARRSRNLPPSGKRTTNLLNMDDDKITITLTTEEALEKRKERP